MVDSRQPVASDAEEPPQVLAAKSAPSRGHVQILTSDRFNERVLPTFWIDRQRVTWRSQNIRAEPVPLPTVEVDPRQAVWSTLKSATSSRSPAIPCPQLASR